MQATARGITLTFILAAPSIRSLSGRQYRSTFQHGVSTSLLSPFLAQKRDLGHWSFASVQDSHIKDGARNSSSHLHPSKKFSDTFERFALLASFSMVGLGKIVQAE